MGYGVGHIGKKKRSFEGPAYEKRGDVSCEQLKGLRGPHYRELTEHDESLSRAFPSQLLMNVNNS